MKNIKAEVITADEATYPQWEGEFVVLLSQLDEKGKHTGQSWAVFQGDNYQCRKLAKNINEGLKFLENN